MSQDPLPVYARRPSSEPSADPAEAAEAAMAATRSAAAAALDAASSAAAGLHAAVPPSLERVVEGAGALARGGVSAVVQGSHRLAATARRAGDETVSYVRHEPVKAMLIAAATGAALMALVTLVATRRHRD